MQDAQMDLGGVAKRFALLCVPLLSVTAAILFILYQTQAAVIEGLTTAGELQIAMSAEREVGQQYSSLVDDVRSLAAQAALLDVVGFVCVVLRLCLFVFFFVLFLFLFC